MKAIGSDVPVIFIFDRLSDPPQCLAQVISGAGFQRFRPEHPGQPLAPVADVGIENQIRKKGLCGARGDFQRLAVALEAELTEEPYF